ncbi:OX-2 membrane glycoprotein-like isoform X2 [Larimichthys crocea]|uniref:OX-2 membrane glycoprotein-like isoform X2 n=1 Tax=Larimichthys crocea TaxID=215358 RepID=UPI000F5E9716|nr:OX-2 membrane glycoprotein-like isoform X2 [Larimichthys crocea]
MSMLNGAVLMLLFVLKKGQSAPVQTQHTVMAAAGDEACLSCQLTQLQEVLKVIWWKIWPERETSLCSYYKDNSQSVNPDFIDKVEFKDAGLQNSSIVIRNVTEQDEGCYQCSFKIDHEDYLSGKTWLKVYELHEPVLHVESNSAEEAVVSCSATGRPAPTVTLRVLQQDLHLSNYSSVSVTNTNSTVTVTSTAVLSGFHDDRTQVGCAVRVFSGPQKEVLMMIPEVKQSTADGLAVISVLLLVVLVVCGIVAALVFVRLKRRNQNSLSHRNVKMNEMVQVTVKDTEETESSSLPHRDNEMNEEDEATVKDTEETEASSDTQNKVQIRRRTSPEKDQSGDNSNPTPSLSKTR